MAAAWRVCRLAIGNVRAFWFEMPEKYVDELIGCFSDVCVAVVVD